MEDHRDRVFGGIGIWKVEITTKMSIFCFFKPLLSAVDMCYFRDDTRKYTVYCIFINK